MSIFSVNSANAGKCNKTANKIHGGGACCTNKIVQKCLSFAVSMFLVLGMAPQNAFGLENHTEDASGNWTINTAQGLVEFQEVVNGGSDFTGRTVTLAADIDLTGTSWAPIGGTESTPFSGIFDGAEYTISNLNNGLFGYISGATVKNLNLKKVTVNGSNIGSICHQATNNSTIAACLVRDGTLVAPSRTGVAGGVCGKADSCTITDCAIINISTTGECSGGICGEADSCTVTKCLACKVGITAGHYSGGGGGICGLANSSTITKCVVSNSRLYGWWASYNNLAGVSFGGNVTDCYSACSYGSVGGSWSSGNNGYFNNERPGAGEGGLSAAEYEQKLREFVDANPEFVKWEKYIFTKTPKSSDFVFSHPKDMAYDGKGKVITIEPKPGITDIGAVTIKYYKVNSDGTLGAASTTLPTDAGRYKVKFDVAESPTNYAATDLPAMF